MAAEKKVSKSIPNGLVDALFQLPLPARQALVRRFNLPVSEDELALPTDPEITSPINEADACAGGEGLGLLPEFLEPLSSALNASVNGSHTEDGSPSSKIEKVSSNGTSSGALPCRASSKLDPELEADALRALMGYGRLARNTKGSHDC